MFFEDEVFVDFFFVLVCGWNFFHDLGIFWDFFFTEMGAIFGTLFLFLWLVFGVFYVDCFSSNFFLEIGVFLC